MIYIFGDSFGDPPPDNPNVYVWPNRLKKIENVKNFCKGGTGPLTAFKDFWSVFDDIKQDDKIVFLLSDPFRVPFNFLEDADNSKNHQPEVSSYFEDECDTTIPNPNMDTSYFNKYEREMQSFHYVMKDELDKLNYKNISLLKCLSMTLKIKIMVFVCSERNTPNGDDHRACLNIDKLNFIALNDNYFRLYDTPLAECSPDSLGLSELGLANRGIDFDNIACHLCKEDQEIVYNIIMNHFYGGDRSETFHNNFRTDFSYSYPENNFPKYLYE
jgi:hypothetical protein